jgi:hypothetical protein
VRVDLAITHDQPTSAVDVNHCGIEVQPIVLAIRQIKHTGLPWHLVLERWYVLLELRHYLVDAGVVRVLYTPKLLQVSIDVFDLGVYVLGSGL